MRHAVWARLATLALTLVMLGGCTYYPQVSDSGGPRMEPKNGRLVRVDNGALCFFDLASTGGYGDTLFAAESQIARRVEILGANGVRVPTVDIPPVAHIAFSPGGFRIKLTDLIQPLTPGDGVVVTLIFAKSGRIGVVSVVE